MSFHRRAVNSGSTSFAIQTDRQSLDGFATDDHITYGKNQIDITQFPAEGMT
jgi:hypothetical protein